MKVLRVIASMDPKTGGPPQGIRNLLPALEAAGVRQQIVCLDSPSASYLDSEILPVRALGPRKTSWAYAKDLAPWLREHLSECDAVICHGLWQYPLLAVRKEIERLRKAGKAPKFYVYPHGMLDPWFQRDPTRRLKAWRNEVYWRLVERRNLHAADAVLFTCEEERRLAATSFSGYAVKEKVVGYGIPGPPSETPAMKEAFHQTCPELPDGQPYLLYLSRIHPKKGVDLVIRAYAGIVRSRERGAGREFPTLVIAGPLDSDYAQEMQQLAIELLPSSKSAFRNSHSAIHFPGMLQGDAKWGALYGAKAFVLPSHQENFGIAVVEALACGTPVLISDKVNIWRETVEAGGGMMEIDDAGGTETLLKRILDMPAEAQEKMRERAKQVYRDRFAVESAAQNLLEYIKNTPNLKKSNGTASE